jgi:hypothetical protein
MGHRMSSIIDEFKIRLGKKQGKKIPKSCFYADPERLKA